MAWCEMRIKFQTLLHTNSFDVRMTHYISWERVPLSYINLSLVCVRRWHQKLQLGIFLIAHHIMSVTWKRRALKKARLLFLLVWRISTRAGDDAPVGGWSSAPRLDFIERSAGHWAVLNPREATPKTRAWQLPSRTLSWCMGRRALAAKISLFLIPSTQGNQVRKFFNCVVWQRAEKFSISLALAFQGWENCDCFCAYKTQNNKNICTDANLWSSQIFIPIFREFK